MNTIGIDRNLDRARIRKLLAIGLFASIMTGLGDFLLYFMLPAAAVFGVFFIGASTVQFIAFAKGRTLFPKWYCVFNLLIGKAVFNSVRRLGNTALINGIGTSNMSLGAIVLFTALLLGWKKYVGDRELAL